MTNREDLSAGTQGYRKPVNLRGDGELLVQADNGDARHLIWSSRKPDDWEILVYNQGEVWEACFFCWPLHHEHVKGHSFESVKQRAEQRIRALEAQQLKTTVWRQTIH